MVVFLICLPLLLSAQTPLAKIIITAERTMEIPAPLYLDVENLSGDLVVSYHLEEILLGKVTIIPCQRQRDLPGRIWWIPSSKIEKGEMRIFFLREGIPEEMSQVVITRDGKALDISLGSSKVLRYHYAPVPPPPDKDSLYTRSGFIHPIWTPGGKVLTRIHPGDHIHHMGFWNPWTKTEFEGRDVDFWNLDDGKGTVRFLRFDTIESGPVYGRFQAVHEHVDLTAPGGEKSVLHEVWDVRFWRPSEKYSNLWIWDFTTSQTCASDQPLKLLKYRYGGFGFRGRADWNAKNSDYLTSEGKTRKDGNGTRARWCKIYGRIDKDSGGLVFMSHPENHEHPEPMRIWPSGDVFCGYCPVVYADWILQPGETYIRRYRVLTFDGDLDKEAIESQWDLFAHPPNIEIEQY